MKRISHHLDEFAKALAASLFSVDLVGKKHFLASFWIVIIYMLGIWWFGAFFNWGDHSLTFQDWADITAPRLQFLRSAVESGQFPLHISDPSTLHGDTYRYLAVPDTLISPQIILLDRFSIQRFNFLNVLLLYTLGFAGLLVLREKFHLSVAAFAFLSLLFNFNGNILAHYSVGHASWGGYFLFPWFAWLVLRLVQGDRSWLWTLGMSLLLFVIWLQGSFHQYLWLLMFLGFVGVFIPRSFWFVLRAGLFALLASAFRILPAILLYGKYQANFMGGYPSLDSIWESLVSIANPTANPFFPSGIQPLGTWETTCFVGLVGAAFLIYFGAVRGLFQREAPYRILTIPLAALLLLSLGRFFTFIRNLPIPMVQGERVSSRIFSVVLVFLIIFAAERFQRWLDQTGKQPFTQWAVVAAFMLMITELRMNITSWKILTVQNVFPVVAFNPHVYFVKNNPADALYLWLVFGGLAVSLLTLLGLAVLAWLEKRHRKISFSDTALNHHLTA